MAFNGWGPHTGSSSIVPANGVAETKPMHNKLTTNNLLIATFFNLGFFLETSCLFQVKACTTKSHVLKLTKWQNKGSAEPSNWQTATGAL